MPIVGGSKSRRTNALLNLINHQPAIDKVYFYAKNPYEAECLLLISIHGGAGLKHCTDFKPLIEYSNYMDDVYENMTEYSLKNRRKILILFDYINAYMLSNRKLNPILNYLSEVGN